MSLDTTPSPATREEKLEAIRAKCIQMNPDGQWRQCECDRCSICMSKHNRRPIRLADVLLAIGSTFAVAGNGIIHEYERYDGFISTGAGWNLSADSLDQQDDHCIDFLFSLLA